MKKTGQMNRGKVKRAIKAMGLRKSWVAEEIGVTRTTFSHFLSGKRNLGKSAQILLAQVLNLNEASEKAS